MIVEQTRNHAKCHQTQARKVCQTQPGQPHNVGAVPTSTPPQIWFSLALGKLLWSLHAPFPYLYWIIRFSVNIYVLCFHRFSPTEWLGDTTIEPFVCQNFRDKRKIKIKKQRKHLHNLSPNSTQTHAREWQEEKPAKIRAIAHNLQSEATISWLARGRAFKIVFVKDNKIFNTVNNQNKPPYGLSLLLLLCWSPFAASHPNPGDWVFAARGRSFGRDESVTHFSNWNFSFVSFHIERFTHCQTIVQSLQRSPSRPR